MTCLQLTRARLFQEDIAKLLRYESSALPAGQLTSLTEYASRMKAGSRNIYYLCAPNRHLAEHSPYFEAMKKKDMEVGELERAAVREDAASEPRAQLDLGVERSSEACDSPHLCVPLSPLRLASTAWGQEGHVAPCAGGLVLVQTSRYFCWF